MESPGKPCWCCGRKGVHYVNGNLPVIPCLACKGNVPSNPVNFTGDPEKKECENSYPSESREQAIREYWIKRDKEFKAKERERMEVELATSR